MNIIQCTYEHTYTVKLVENIRTTYMYFGGVLNYLAIIKLNLDYGHDINVFIYHSISNYLNITGN